MLRRSTALLARAAASSLRDVGQRAWWLPDGARQCTHRPASIGQATVTTWMRSWASNSKDEAQGPVDEATQAAAPEGSGATAEGEEEATPLDPRDEEIAKHKEEVAALKDKLVRLLADMENLRERSARQVESAHKFAIQGFVKDFLEVPDTLERALSTVQESLKQAGSDAGVDALDKDKTASLLKGLVEGIELTDKIMMQIFGKNGLERMQCAVGDAFDPNLHNAMFELPDPSKEPGSVAHIVKTGYTLHGRVVRPASVGVVKAPDQA